MRVSEDAAVRFIGLYTRLLYYAGQQRDILPPDMSFNDFFTESMQVKVDCRDAIYEPSPLLEDFLAAERDNLSVEEQNIVASWQNYISGTFIVLRHLKKHTIFLSSESPSRAYGVVSLTTDLEELLPTPFLPIYVKTVLLPYEDVIVCDGLLSSYNVTFGPGMRSGFNEDYRTMRQTGRVFTTLGIRKKK